MERNRNKTIFTTAQLNEIKNRSKKILIALQPEIKKFLMDDVLVEMVSDELEIKVGKKGRFEYTQMILNFLNTNKKKFKIDEILNVDGLFYGRSFLIQFSVDTGVFVVPLNIYKGVSEDNDKKSSFSMLTYKTNINTYVIKRIDK